MEDETPTEEEHIVEISPPKSEQTQTSRKETITYSKRVTSNVQTK